MHGVLQVGDEDHELAEAEAAFLHLLCALLVHRRQSSNDKTNTLSVQVYKLQMSYLSSWRYYAYEVRGVAVFVTVPAHCSRACVSGRMRVCMWGLPMSTPAHLSLHKAVMLTHPPRRLFRASVLQLMASQQHPRVEWDDGSVRPKKAATGRWQVDGHQLLDALQAALDARGEVLHHLTVPVGTPDVVAASKALSLTVSLAGMEVGERLLDRLLTLVRRAPFATFHLDFTGCTDAAILLSPAEAITALARLIVSSAARVLRQCRASLRLYLAGACTFARSCCNSSVVGGQYTYLATAYAWQERSSSCVLWWG